MENYTDKNCLILGLGISGKGVYHTLKLLGANIFVFDEKVEKSQVSDAKIFKKLNEKIIKDMDYIIFSPTFKLSKKFKKIAKKHDVSCMCEFDFAYSLNKGKIFAITGSNGKTTTVTLLKQLLDTTKNKNYLLGNIGTAFSSEVLNVEEADNVVLECSSFQLMKTKIFKPHIAGLLNLAPDHLDFHKDLNEYYNSKLKIFAHQNEDDFAVVNYDDELCVKKTKNIQSQIYYFSTKKACKGMFVADDTIFFSDGIITYPVVKLENIRFIGEHNLSNYLCASLMAILQGVSLESIAYVLNNFRPPAHRLEFVRRFQNVDYYNDSKATNISATLTDCKAFEKNIHLLLGGSEKGEDYSQLNNLPKNVKYIYLFGKSQNKIYKKIKKNKNFSVYKCDTITNAINFASLKSIKGEVVLLSPACASFDSFANFEERGNYFKEIVNNLT